MKPRSKPAPTRQVLLSESKRKAASGPIKILYACNIGCFTGKIKSRMTDQQYPLPPATFEFLILSLKAQTEMHLGMYHFGDEKERPEPDFRIARHTIDLLAMLQEKTRGNVTIEEQRLVDNALTELRFRFVQAMENKEKKTVAEVESPEVEPKEEQAGA